MQPGFIQHRQIGTDALLSKGITKELLLKDLMRFKDDKPCLKNLNTLSVVMMERSNRYLWPNVWGRTADASCSLK